MHSSRSRRIRGGQEALVASLVAALVLLVAALAPTAAAASPRFGHHGPPSFGHHGPPNFDHADVRFEWLPGYDDPSTPNNFDRVGVLKVGPPDARNVLVLNPGTSA